MEPLENKKEQVEHYEHAGAALVSQAQAIKIVDQVTREQAAAFSVNAAKAVKTIEAEFDGDKKMAYTLWKSIGDRITRLCDPFRTAKQIVDREISRDWQEQEAIRRKAEQKAREEAAERERKERERLAKLAEKQMERGAFGKAEETIQRIDEVFVPAVMPAMPEPVKTTKSAAGATTVVEDIEVEVVDPMAFFKAVAAGTLPQHLADVKVGEVKRYAKATKAASLPGIRITKTSRVSTRAA
jgi:hypothetical protein